MDEELVDLVCQGVPSTLGLLKEYLQETEIENLEQLCPFDLLENCRTYREQLSTSIEFVKAVNNHTKSAIEDVERNEKDRQMFASHDRARVVDRALEIVLTWKRTSVNGSAPNSISSSDELNQAFNYLTKTLGSSGEDSRPSSAMSMGGFRGSFSRDHALQAALTRLKNLLRAKVDPKRDFPLGLFDLDFLVSETKECLTIEAALLQEKESLSQECLSGQWQSIRTLHERKSQSEPSTRVLKALIKELETALATDFPSTPKPAPRPQSSSAVSRLILNTDVSSLPSNIIAAPSHPTLQPLPLSQSETGLDTPTSPTVSSSAAPPRPSSARRVRGAGAKENEVKHWQALTEALLLTTGEEGAAIHTRDGVIATPAVATYNNSMIMQQHPMSPARGGGSPAASTPRAGFSLSNGFGLVRPGSASSLHSTATSALGRAAGPIGVRPSSSSMPPPAAPPHAASDPFLMTASSSMTSSRGFDSTPAPIKQQTPPLGSGPVRLAGPVLVRAEDLEGMQARARELNGGSKPGSAATVSTSTSSAAVLASVAGCATIIAPPPVPPSAMSPKMVSLHGRRFAETRDGAVKPVLPGTPRSGSRRPSVVTAQETDSAPTTAQ